MVPIDWGLSCRAPEGRKLHQGGIAAGDRQAQEPAVSLIDQGSSKNYAYHEKKSVYFKFFSLKETDLFIAFFQELSEACLFIKMMIMANTSSTLLSVLHSSP